MSEHPIYTFESKAIANRIPLFGGWGLFPKLINISATVTRVFKGSTHSEYKVAIWGEDGLVASIDHQFAGEDSEQGALWALADAYGYLEQGNRYFVPYVEPNIERILIDRLRMILTSQHGWWIPQLIANFDFRERARFYFILFHNGNYYRVETWGDQREVEVVGEDDRIEKVRKSVFQVSIHRGATQRLTFYGESLHDRNDWAQTHEMVWERFWALIDLHAPNNRKLRGILPALEEVRTHYMETMK